MKKGLLEYAEKIDAKRKPGRDRDISGGKVVAPGATALHKEGYDPLKHSPEYRAKMMRGSYQLPARGVVAEAQRADRARAEKARAQLHAPTAPPPLPLKRGSSAPTKHIQRAEKSTACPCGSGRPLKSCCVAFAPVKEKAVWEATPVKCRHVFDIDIPIDVVPKITKKTISQKIKENPDYVHNSLKRWLALKGNNFQWPNPGEPDPNEVKNKFKLFSKQCGASTTEISDEIHPLFKILKEVGKIGGKSKRRYRRKKKRTRRKRRRRKRSRNRRRRQKRCRQKLTKRRKVKKYS